MADVLVDTDASIDHLRGAVELRARGHRVYYSVVTRAELLAGNTTSELVTTLLAPFREVPVERDIAERAGRIRRETSVRLPDALIAATAIEGRHSLVTRNRADFLPAVSLGDMKSFYTAAFGWTWVDYGPTYAAFEGAGIEGGLSTEASVGEAHDPGAQSAIGPLVLFGTEDLDAVEARVRQAGGEIASGPYEYPGGRRFHYRDPSGNILGVYQSQPID